MDILPIRTRIDQIDTELIKLLNERFALSEHIALYKDERHLPITDLVREKALVSHLQSHAKFPVEPLWQRIMGISKTFQYAFLSKKHNQQNVGIAIQGGKWSFNDIALRSYLKTQKIIPEIHYAYTTEAVLSLLNEWKVMYGQFAIANSIGWLVDETIQVLWKYDFTYEEHYEIPIEHSLLALPWVHRNEIGMIMGHDQALRQCQWTLRSVFSDVECIAGTGEYMDNAAIAAGISDGSIAWNTACIGHRSLADIYGLEIIEDHMEDRKDNRTTFVLVRKSY